MPKEKGRQKREEKPNEKKLNFRERERG